jgi:hypothetical protein
MPMDLFWEFSTLDSRGTRIMSEHISVRASSQFRSLFCSLVFDPELALGNQRAFPQHGNQKRGCGFPIARIAGNQPDWYSLGGSESVAAA